MVEQGQYPGNSEQMAIKEEEMPRIVSYASLARDITAKRLDISDSNYLPKVKIIFGGELSGVFFGIPTTDDPDILLYSHRHEDTPFGTDPRVKELLIPDIQIRELTAEMLVKFKTVSREIALGVATAQRVTEVLTVELQDENREEIIKDVLKDFIEQLGWDEILGVGEREFEEIPISDEDLY